MKPFSAFMNVENTRFYIDDLYSSDPTVCLGSILCIKNTVIGSNRQKESVIAQGIVPRLMQLLRDSNVRINVRIEAAVTLGSLAKGTDDHIELLLKSGAIQLLLDLLDEENSKLVDACLCCLRTLSQQDTTSLNKYTLKRLQKLLSFAGLKENTLRQECVATILGAACKTVTEQNNLCTAGAPLILASLLTVPSTSVRIPVITCLAAMSYNNPSVAFQIANTEYNDSNIPKLLSTLICRYRPIEMQLEAARCLTNLHRAGAIPANDPIITYRTLSCLVQLCQIDNLELHRAVAADALAYLTEVDSELQKIAAISNQLVAAMVDLLNCQSVAARQAAFRVFASLAANDEDIRKRIIDTKCLMEKIMEGLQDENKDIILAAVRCLHSLSRSVQQLRTTFQDHSVWKLLMPILIDYSSTELLTAASSALCNLLLEFSPAKEPMVQQGIITILAELVTKPEPSIRLNGIWALMNLAFQAEQRVKSSILNSLGTDKVFRLLDDPDPRVIMKTLGLLRNLVSPRPHTDAIMALHGVQIMQGIVFVLESAHAPEIKEQALCILGNIADGDRARDHIMMNEDILKKVIAFMSHPAVCLQETSVFCIQNLARKGEPGVTERQNRLKDMGVVNILQSLMGNSSSQTLYNRVKAAHSQFMNDV
ncbi:armadillo repeat-containing protein 8-like [Coccinella septempunctata]|uniref:armadillo repeat-containing protein 8-like n=1 Tax=Coccinella septempunctata TaxID=41139 RepID=UPI001D095803|nr:armadillo repeat-containing protein 8-like [Coccinella septempunctata]